MAGETTVGGLVGFLRLDADQFHRELAAAIAEAEKLNATKVDVKVDVDGAAKSTAELAAVGAEADRASDSTTRLGASSKNAQQGVGAMATAVLTLGPALIPLGVAAAGAAAGLAGMGVAGVAAVAGVKQEMAAGTAVGQSYSAGIATVKQGMSSLASVAAGNVLGPFQQTVADLDRRMPALTGQVGDLASVTGRTAAVLAGGLLGAFQALGPLMRDVAGYTENLAQRFAGLVASGGVTSFADYVRSVFPQVVAQVEAIAGAAVRLVAALAPLGSGVLSALGTLANVINALPVDVLSVLASTAAAVFLGFRTWSALVPLIAGMGGALQSLTGSAEGAAVAVNGLRAAAGVVGVAIGALSLMFTANAEKARQTEAAVSQLTDMLRASNGVVDESIRAWAANQLATSGALDQAKTFGLSLADVTSASLGNAQSIATVNQRLTEWAASQGAAGADADALTGKVDAFKQQIGLTSGELSTATQRYRDQKAAIGDTTGVLDQHTRSTTAAGSATTWFGLATMSTTGATKDAAQALQALNAQLDAELSRALALAGAQTGLDQALLTLTETLRRNKGSMDEHTQAGIDDRRAIEGAAQAMLAKRDADIKAGTSIAEATAKYQSQSQALVDTATKTYGANSAVVTYLKELVKIPPEASTTVKANTAGAEASIGGVLAMLANVRDKTVTVTANYALAGNAYTGLYAGKPAPAADGMILSGGVKTMAAGDVGRQAMFSSTPILWGEAGPEAYIPLSPAKRERSTALLAETNRLMGNPLGVTGRGRGPLEITGALEIGGDGLARIIDGRITLHDEKLAMMYRAGRRIFS